MADETNRDSTDEHDAAEDAPDVEAAASDEVDPELMRIPRRRRRRHPLIAVVVIVLGLYVMWFLREDLVYFFQPRQPVDLGEVSEAIKQGRLRHNTHVTLHGAPDRKHALILESSSGYDSFFRLLQSESQVFVQRHRALRSTDQEVSATHTGRLVRFDSLPYADNMRDYFKKSMTVAHDLPFDEVARARKAGKDRAELRDVGGRKVQVGPDSLIWINAAFKNEWVVQFRKQAYPKAEPAEAKVRELNLPFAPDSETSTMFWRFVVHAAPDEVPLLMARFRGRALSDGGVVRRQLSYSARWNQLAVRDGALEINAADPTFPALFREQPSTGEGQPATLVRREERPVTLPKDAILYIETSSPLTVGPDAMVLLSGEEPGESWFYLVLYGVLGLFVVINLFSLALRLRDRRAH